MPRKAGPEPKGSRLRKWVCPCGVIVRVGRKDFLAHCGRCGMPFVKAPAVKLPNSCELAASTDIHAKRC